jgi:LemA protein
MKKFMAMVAILATVTLSGCGYNDIQRQDEEVSSNWSEVLNQYKRRADLVPQLVNVVQGYASHEKDVLISVAEARSKVGSLNVSAETLKDPKAMEAFKEAQAQMGSALSRLMSISERYPELKANEGFRDLQSQLEGTENRITVARNRYIKAVQTYNITIRSFPSNLTAKAFSYETKPQFTVENEATISKAPEVKFGK